MDEVAKSATKRKHIQAGVCTEEDILGNVEADKLANLGREQHDDITSLLQLSEDRVNVTTLVQKMMLHIWTDYVENASSEVKAADAADTAQMENIDNAALHEADTQFDYDPFAGASCNQQDKVHIPSATGTASAELLHAVDDLSESLAN